MVHHRLYLQRHGLREERSETGTRIKLCCSKEREARAYHQDEVYYEIVDHLKTVAPPVHYIFGEREDLM